MRMDNGQTYSLSLIERPLPNSNFSLDMVLVLASFVRLHALGIVFPQQPGDLLATAGRERMRKDLNTGLVLGKHTLEKVAWRSVSRVGRKVYKKTPFEGGRYLLPLRGWEKRIIWETMSTRL